jgi:hypothetical protein
MGSLTGRYATLDLKEASDRVSVGLVRLLFPQPLLEALEACRSQSTVLPSGEELKLNKFAPMGSALCFPVMAITCWAILTAGLPDADYRAATKLWKNQLDGTAPAVYVYGDDVIVPTAHAANAIEQLESFGLKINRDKCCTSGFFRESCGMDAYRGTPVTPVRLRTVWSSHRCPSVYTSWISYANSMHEIQYFNTYELIVGWLTHVYGEIPERDMDLPCPSLIEVPEVYRPKRTRTNKSIQNTQVRAWSLVTRPLHQEIDGWKMLLRYCVEANSDSPPDWMNDKPRRCGVEDTSSNRRPFSASSYTKRNSDKLVMRWLPHVPA